MAKKKFKDIHWLEIIGKVKKQKTWLEEVSFAFNLTDPNNPHYGTDVYYHSESERYIDKNRGDYWAAINEVLQEVLETFGDAQFVKYTKKYDYDMIYEGILFIEVWLIYPDWFKPQDNQDKQFSEERKRWYQLHRADDKIKASEMEFAKYNEALRKVREHNEQKRVKGK